MDRVVRIRLNKNRGWRGLAELDCINERKETIHKMIFSFSPNVWNDMLRGYIVLQNEDKYVILNFDNTEMLPKPTQQRSVLIKEFQATVMNSWEVPKDSRLDATGDLYDLIYHFKKNRNNHTTSDWNCIGVRVMPDI